MKNIDKISSALIGLVVFVIYCFTMSPTISGHDSSELAAVQSTLGIAHPTGYPLFTMLGYLFSKIPIFSSQVFNLNLLNALWGVFAIVVFYFVQILVLTNVYKENISNNYLVRIVSGFGCFLLAFSFTYWSQSLAVEVYTLHFFLLMMILLAGLKSYFANQEQNVSIKSIYKKWFWVTVFIGLGFTNHLSTLYIIPAILFLYFSKNGFSKKSFGVAALLLFLMLGIIIVIYSYLPIRSAQNPDLNWGAPFNFNSFIYHVTGGLYQEHFMSGLSSLKKQALHYLQSLFAPEYWQFNIAILLSLIGVEFLIRKQRKILSFFVIAFLTNLFFALNYKIPDVDAYFMLSYIILVMSCCIAIVGIYQVISNEIFRRIALATFITVALGIQVFSNFNKLDYSDNYLFLDYTKVVLNSVDRNAVILCSPMTPVVFPSLYLQNVERLRKDVAVISITLNQRWYLEQIGKYHPDIVNLESNEFVLNFSKRPIYIYSEMVKEIQLPKGFTAVPDKYLFKVVNSTEYYKSDQPAVNVRFTKNEYNPYLLYIKYNLAIILESRLKYEEQFQKIDIAKKYSDLLRSNFPDFPYNSEYYYP